VTSASPSSPWSPRGGPLIGVGMQRIGLGTGRVAHAIVPRGPQRTGVTCCGHPTDHLAVVPALEWADVVPNLRCRDCLAATGDEIYVM